VLVYFCEKIEGLTDKLGDGCYVTYFHGLVSYRTPPWGQTSAAKRCCSATPANTELLPLEQLFGAIVADAAEAERQ